ncbi:hypothetical protein [Inquilinus limosus]|uniref:Uncharacterized protein n=1 Tax=Inquilinus limosus MP06 TaxID=1398085 RepID=A0A0A0CXL7_9PROT|nr:hypothetical protein [Inquilinus limosus]KGM30520.1 hypothetical protein P409_32530 [Inquilinus limosus MP06]
MTRPRWTVAGALLAALALTADPAAAHDHTSRGRLVFADHEAPVVSVLDLDTGKVTHSFPITKADPALIGTEGGRFVVIRTGDDAGTIRLLDSGLFFESHEDHFDIEKGEVRLLDLVLTGDKPSHVVSEKGWLTVFFDGQRPWLGKSDPKIVALRLDALDRGTAEPEVWPAPAPQHGIAVPLGGDRFLVSVSKEAYAKGDDRSVSSRPNGFEILDRSQGWKAVASFNDASDSDRSCKEFHGHAALGETHVFGCNPRIEGSAASDGGVLVIGPGPDGAWGSRKLAYPDGRRASTIKGRAAGRYLVANYGGENGRPFEALLRIDPTADALAAADVFPIPAGQAVCQYEVTNDGRRVVNLTQDGKLRVYDIAPEWKAVAEFDAVPAFDCAWDAATPAPAVAIIGNSAFVSDPENGRIREFYLNSLKQGLDVPVGGKPSAIAGGAAAG